ncbi:MAG: ISL3 family transposase [Thermodesulfovibrionales bacterium]|nr:ISL3 family transposase [Thermodesulfovibrionales bacterium]
MQDRELYRQLLGLKEPWEVTEVKIDFKELKVDIWVTWPPEKQVPCPECGKKYMIYDHREERQWRHLDTMQFQTMLHCRIPRIACTEHGVKSIDVPWAERNSRFTALFERLAIDVLLGCQNQTKAMELLNLSWDEVHNIQDKAVQRGLSRRSDGELKYIGVDEKSFLKGHQYATVVSDLNNPRVIDVAKDRKEESLSEVLNNIPDEQRAGISAVAMDMWEPYMKAVRALLPETDIVHDKFHISKYLCEAVDKVRKAENKGLMKEGIEDLKGTRYLWLTNPNNWTDGQKGLFKELKNKRLKVGRAWTLKEMFSDLWEYTYEKAARNFFKKWYWWATHSRLKPITDVGKILKRHLDNILTYLKHRITNAVSEGLNSKIQQIKSAARGFRNFENYRIAILFYCGKLDMYPHKSQ